MQRKETSFGMPQKRTWLDKELLGEMNELGQIMHISPYSSDRREPLGWFSSLRTDDQGLYSQCCYEAAPSLLQGLGYATSEIFARS